MSFRPHSKRILCLFSFALALGAIDLKGQTAASSPDQRPIEAQAGSCSTRHQDRHTSTGWVSTMVPVMTGAYTDASLSKTLVISLRLAAEEEAKPAFEAAQRAHDEALQKHNPCAEAIADLAAGRSMIYSEPIKAMPWLLQAETGFSAFPDVSNRAIVHLELGSAQWQLGNIAEAIRQYQQGEPQFRSIGDDAHALYMRYKIVTLQEHNLVPFAVMRQILDELTPLQGVAASTTRILADSSLANTRSRQGDFAAAMTFYRQGLAEMESCECGHGQAFRIRNGMALLELTMGRPAAALTELQVASKLLHTSKVQTFSDELLFDEARVYQYLHQDRRAAALYRQALQSIPQGSAPPFYLPYLQSNLGGIEMRTGQVQRGLHRIEEASTGKVDVIGHCILFINLGDAYWNVHQLPEAAKALTSAVDACQAAHSDDLLGKTLAQRARVLLNEGDLPGAVKDIRAALLNIEALRSHLVPDDAYKRDFEQTISVYDIAIQVLTAAHQDEEALEASEQARGRAFMDLLATIHSPAPSASSSTLATDLASVTHVSAPTLPGLEAAISRLHSTLLSYWVSDDTLYLWIVRPGQPLHLVTRQLSRSELDSLIRATRTNPGLVSKASTASWQRLYHLLLAPAEPFLPTEQGSLLTIVPHGPLFTLSFAALQDSHGRYLLERHALHTVPSIGLLRYTEANDLATANLAPHYLFLANPLHFASLPNGERLPPLPGTSAEVHAIAATLPADKFTVLEGQRASIDGLLRELPNATSLHIATHAIVSDTDPLGSFLALDETRKGGKLTAAAVYGLSMHTRLVTLSACSTGLGQITGDGVAGLSRAFFYAGSAALVATLWEVPDGPSARILTPFYRALSQGSSRSAALRTAQLAMLEDLRHGRVQVATLSGTQVLPENPFFWAAFSLSGEP